MADKFLIVDDSRLARMMASGLIAERHSDAVVVEAENADQALEAARHQTPDHVILDHNMPGTSGLDLVEGLRGVAPNASMTLVTANIQSAIRQRAEQLGCRFIANP
ncbi:MAG: response regulator [Alphaproteobacteria bacterium]|nr:response regulator [Rhodospirillaceae bacterium]MDG2481468.1 response regulator [Alphaproteobacteria bacterium]MBT6203693.1 response regulator [Rhodospirillaceae bacterium]MBT6509998.1 response regulator [Rhodospirillaceae bacterium]MBT7615628.1 response regulator [Rhodospirillaceae bacterium]